jgi:hypothetical protein
MNPGSLGLLERLGENLGGVQRCLSDCEIAPGLSRVRHVFRRIGQKHLFGLFGYDHKWLKPIRLTCPP